MEIEIRLVANLGKLLPPGPKNKRVKIAVEEGITVDELIDDLKIPPNVTNVVMVNGTHKDKSTKLSEGDVVSIILPVMGG